MKYMISIFLHRIYMDAMPIKYNSSYIGIEDIYAIFLIVEIIAAFITSMGAICIIIAEKGEKTLVVEEGNKSFVKKPIYWIIFAIGCCFILILSYLILAENRTYHVPYQLIFLVTSFIPLGFFLLNAGMLRFIVSHLEKDISDKDVTVRTLIVLGIILIIFAEIVGHIDFSQIITVNPSY